MDARIMLWVVIGVMFAVALFLTFKAGAVSGEVASSAGSATKSAASSYNGMVGGC